jgi:complement component 1 Q subcomponent-binding protein, mitochondrial
MGAASAETSDLEEAADDESSTDHESEEESENWMFYIEDVEFFKDSTQALTESAEADYKRQFAYAGPVFDQLDDSLQNGFYEYLEDKGVDAELISTLAQFAEWKEQSEYTKWLENVHSFVSASPPPAAAAAK